MSEKEAIVEKLKSIAGDLNASSVPRHEFLRRTGLSERKVQRLFGSYNKLVVAAGLQPEPSQPLTPQATLTMNSWLKWSE